LKYGKEKKYFLNFCFFLEEKQKFKVDDDKVGQRVDKIEELIGNELW
jgi:hypothetical protein